MKTRYLVFLIAVNAHALTPRNGWTFIPGAQDLLQVGQWSCTVGAVVQAGSLSMTTGAAANSLVNSSGPPLLVQGDFSVLATISNPSGLGAWFSLYGALNSGGAIWQGIKRLDVGVAGGNIDIEYYLGNSPNPTSMTFSGVTDPIALEMARIGSQIVIFANGTQVGAFADPGLFDSGQVHFGLSVTARNTVNVTALAGAMPSGGGSSTGLPANTVVAARTGSGLRDLADPSGFLVGAASDSVYFNDSRYTQALGREFNLVVPENSMKFAQTEPGPHQFNFCAGDQLVGYAQANVMKVRGHNLVWGSNLPNWLNSGNYSTDESSAILQEHIATVAGHFKGELIEWDVVNEAISDSAPYDLKSTYWLTQLGSSYVDQAFQWAHAADPNAKLFYNDYSGEGIGGKADGIYNFVKGMVSRGVPIDGVGLQMHLTLTSGPSAASIAANIARLGALGLEVHITEMDVRVPVDASGTASNASLTSQAAIYQQVLSACRAAPNCTASLTWGFTDAHSWIPSTFAGFGAGLPYDGQYNAKPAYTAMTGVLSSAAGGGPVISTGGIVIHGGASAVISPGSLVDIYGSNLAASAATAPGFPLPATLGGVQVLVNGTAAPLYYVAPDQIDFQLPYDTAPGPVLIQVKGGASASGDAAVTVQQAAPSILTYGANRAVVQNPDHSVNGPGNCAASGATLTAYLIGSGPLDNAIATGAAAPQGPLSRETLTTTATLGGIVAPVSFAGMTPSFAGLMQVNFQVPAGSGDLALQIQVGDAASNAALVCVK